MRNRLLLVVVCAGASLLGGAAAQALLLPSMFVSAEPAQSGQLVGKDTDNKGSGNLSDRFQVVTTQFAPSVVAVDAVRPPAPGKTQPEEESGSGVIVRFPNTRGV